MTLYICVIAHRGEGGSSGTRACSFHADQSTVVDVYTSGAPFLREKFRVKCEGVAVKKDDIWLYIRNNRIGVLYCFFKISDQMMVICA